MKQYKLYIFDLDLTAVDSIESSKICYRAAFNACGLVFDESKTNYYLNQNLKETYEEIEADAPNCGMDFFNAFVAASATAFAKYAKFYPEIEDVFNKLVERGAKIALFTNRNAHDIQALLDANPNVKKNVSFFVGSDMVKNKKPDPEGINICSEKLNIIKKDILYVGDSPCDYGAANAANVDFYYVDRYNNNAIPVEGHATIKDMVN